jgi:hypothetical protein
LAHNHPQVLPQPGFFFHFDMKRAWPVLLGVLDRRSYTPGRKVTEEEMANSNIKPSRFHGEWNYVIHPHR